MPVERISKEFRDVSLTLKVNPINFDILILRNETAIARAIRNLILTVPGERLFNAKLGCNISRSLFELIDPISANSIKDEMGYLDKKKDCGFDGFFSQPFFDLRLLEIFLENYENDEIYWGISPVTSIRSKNYWETRNRASFPKEFTPSFEWNVNFAKRAIEYLDKKKHQLYFMPIKIDMEKYLKCIFY